MFSINMTAIKAAPIQIYTFVTMLSSFQHSIFNRFIVLPRCYARPCALCCYSNGRVITAVGTIFLIHFIMYQFNRLLGVAGIYQLFIYILFIVLPRCYSYVLIWYGSIKPYNIRYVKVWCRIINVQA